MKTITYPVNPLLDKSNWPPGEWDNEPDKVQWEDKETGMPCLVVRNRMGALCGYVGVPQGHRFHGVGYDRVYLGDEDGEYPPAHGGLTFSNTCMEGVSEGEGICHVVEPGEDDHVWWLGFDCGHSMDVIPRMLAFEMEWQESHPEETRLDHDWGATYKNLAYVQGICAELAAWLKAAT